MQEEIMNASPVAHALSAAVRRPLSRRTMLIGMGAATAAVGIGHSVFGPGADIARAADGTTSGAPFGLPALRLPASDQGVEQRDEERLRWLRDAKLGMFIHWGVYSGPAKGEWYMRNSAITPENYKKYLTDATSQQFTASAYDPTQWATLAQDFGAKYTVLTTRHHDGYALWPSAHPNAWTSGQAPIQRDFVRGYVNAVRAAGLKVGLYYSPINWQYPGYYDVYGTNCATNTWGYTTDPAHKENARIMKNEVYQAVRELVTQYGAIDDLWWDGGWLAEQGTDAAASFFWEPGQFRTDNNEWPVDDEYGETDEAGKKLGLMGLVRKHQPGIVSNARSGWVGDYRNEEGGSVPTGSIRTGPPTEKCFTVCGTWGYNATASTMTYGATMNILVNAWVRDITCLVNVGPDRTGVVPAAQASLLRRVGQFMSSYGQAVYETRGGPWQPVDGKYGFTYRNDTYFVHLLPGYSGTTFTAPAAGDATVVSVTDLSTGSVLPFTVGSDGSVSISGINRTVSTEDSIVAVKLDRDVIPTGIAFGAAVTASSERSGAPGSNAVDGSVSSVWAAADSSADQWLQVDLGQARRLTGARLVWALDKTNYRYRLDGSGDGRNWATLSNRVQTASTSQIQTLVFSAEVRHVRLTVTGLPAGVSASVRSLELYDRAFTAGSDVESGIVNIGRADGSTVSASFYQTDSQTLPPANAVDGSTSTTWSTWTRGTMKSSATFTVMTTKSYYVKDLTFTNTEGVISGVTVEYLDADDQVWKATTASGVVPSANGTATRIVFDSVAATGIRLTFATPASYLKIPEIAIYGMEPTVPVSGMIYNLITRHSNMALEVAGGSTSDGAAIVQRPVDAGTNKRWKLTSTSSGFYRLEAQNSNKALNVSGASSENGASIIQWPYSADATYNDEWRLVDMGGGYYQLVNRRSGKALDMPGANTTAGTQFIQYTAGSTANQQFKFVLV